MKIIATNKKARHEYFLHDEFECGIVLKGTEIKSIRAAKANINDAYCLVRNDEMFIINMFISVYKEGNIFNHNERRSRKLLLHKKEIIKIRRKLQEDSFTCIPLQVYIEKGLCKIKIALAKGKKNYDKRQTLKEKDAKRNIERKLKERY